MTAVLHHLYFCVVAFPAISGSVFRMAWPENDFLMVKGRAQRVRFDSVAVDAGKVMVAVQFDGVTFEATSADLVFWSFIFGSAPAVRKSQQNKQEY